MKIGQGKITEIFLDGSVQIACSPNLIPAAGQYALAHQPASNSPLPVSLFFMESSAYGFRAAPPMPFDWKPGDLLNVRGPIGNGFHIPNFAKKIALIAFEESMARLYGLISSSLKQNKEVVVVCNSTSQNLPEAVEAQPLQALNDVLRWADYLAIDIARENLNRLKENFGEQRPTKNESEAQVLIYTAMPCGGIAECGICALTFNRQWKMICKEGPVFALAQVIS